MSIVRNRATMGNMRSLRWQLVASHLVPVVFMAFVLAAAIKGFVSVGRSIDSARRMHSQTVIGTQEMASALQEQETAFALMLSGEGREAKQLQEESWRQFQVAYRAAAVLRTTDNATRTALKKLWDDANRFESLTSVVMSQNETRLRPDAVTQIRGRLQPMLRALRNQAHDVLLASDKATDQANQIARAQTENWSLRILAASVITFCLALWFAGRLVRIALTPLALLARQAESIAAGDLEAKSNLVRKDEIGILATSFDDMASKLAEARQGEMRKRRRLEAMTDAALESLSDPVIVTDSHMRIAHLNRAAQVLFGTVPTSPRKKLEDHITDRRIVHAIEKAMTEEQELHPDDERLLVPMRSENEERMFRLRSNVIHGEGGKSVGIVTVLEDVTYLRALDRMKTEFIGVAAHELRTPITSLLLSAQILGEGAAGSLNEIQGQIVHAQREELERLGRLIEELLDLTKLEAGTSPPKLEWVPVKELVRSPVQSVRPLAEAKGVDLCIEIPDGISNIQADISQIGRVLTNLLANAIRHTPYGGKVSIIASESQYDVTLRVRDTGEGIPTEYLDRIFERFVQVPGATRGGAGLGLAIANRIVHAHGGDMSVKSEVGKGSEFSFSLSKETATPGGEKTF
jgi:signal transduction histidine kinase